MNAIPRTRTEALAMRKIVELAAQGLDDATASLVPSWHGKLEGKGALVHVNTRVPWGDDLMRAKVDLWDTEANDPDNAPTLWEKVMYKEGHRIIPENIPAEDPFTLDELGWWTDGLLYKSLLSTNVWTPAQMSEAWEVVEV